MAELKAYAEFKTSMGGKLSVNPHTIVAVIVRADHIEISASGQTFKVAETYEAVLDKLSTAMRAQATIARGS